MRYLKILFVTITFMLASVGSSMAADKCQPEVYMLGFAFSFNDSTLYLTQVHKVENVWLKSRNKMLIERETYATQLNNYFKADGINDMTCGLCYSVKEKKVVKKLNAIKRRYQKRFKNIRIIMLSPEQFQFKSFVPMQIEDEKISEALAKNKKNKKSKKK